MMSCRITGTLCSTLCDSHTKKFPHIHIESVYQHHNSLQPVIRTQCRVARGLRRVTIILHKTFVYENINHKYTMPILVLTTFLHSLYRLYLLTLCKLSPVSYSTAHVL